MNWLLLTIFAILSRATFGIATKVLSNNVKVSPITQSVLLTGAAAILTVLVSPFIGGLSFHGLASLWPIALLMTVSQAFGNIVFFKGLEKLEASSAQVVFASILIWSTILSVIFLGSHFSYLQLVGIFILLGAILLVQYRKGVTLIDRNALYILAAAALFAVFQITSAEMAKTVSAGAYLLTAYLGATVIIGLGYWSKVKADIPALTKKASVTLKATLFASATSLLYFVFAYFAYQKAPDRGVVVVLLTAQVVVTVVLAIIFLKERDYIKRKLAAGVLAVIAGFLIKS